MEKQPLPPKLFTRFFSWFCDPALHPYIEGDLLELYYERHARSGKRKADILYICDIFLLFRPGIIRSPSSGTSTNRFIMTSNYYKVGVRNMIKHKAFSFINVFGLALAMSVSMLVISMLSDQNRYDKFHRNADRIYRITSGEKYATSPQPTAAALKGEYSIIQEAFCLTPGVGGDGRCNGNLADMRGYFTEPAFFRVLGFSLELGNVEQALVDPHAMVITRNIARKLFRDENPIGKTIDFDDRKLAFPLRFDGIAAPPVPWGTFTVTGVIDETRYKSHLEFDVLVSSSTLPMLYAEQKMEDKSESWDWYFRTYTFVLLREGKTQADLDHALRDLVARKYKDIHSEQVKDFRLQSQNIHDIQLELKGNDTGTRLPLVIYYFLGALAFIIILSACLNYTNLSIARALTRAKEIGVRKVSGANKKALIYQFLVESLLTAMLALGVAILMLALIKPAFRNLWVNQYLQFELPERPGVYLIFMLLTVGIGLLSGIYPAFRLSSFKPVKALKTLHDKRPGSIGMYKILSVVQFVISLFFITSSILVYNQFKHFMQFDYGFDARGIINVELQGADYEKVSNAFNVVPGVMHISASDLIPSTGTNNGSQFKLADTDEDAYRFFSVLNTDENFVSNVTLEIIAGRNLPPAMEGDPNSIVVNETVVKELGFKHPSEIIGQVLDNKWSDEQLQVVGVIKNFRYKLLIDNDEIGGLILRNQPSLFQYANVRIVSPDKMLTIRSLEEKWAAIDPLHPMKYKFFTDELQSTHQAILDIVTILGFIALLSIVIACLGLLGMATYTAERKRKEIGIRKILGAENFAIAFLLSKGFLKMLALSVCIGAPLSYVVNNLWLQQLANRVEFGIGTLLLSICMLLVLGILTIGSQTFKASVTNPVDSLKVE